MVTLIPAHVNKKSICPVSSQRCFMTWKLEARLPILDLTEFSPMSASGTKRTSHRG
jgi:hypothetical protein